MTAMIRVSIVMLNYNGLVYLKKTVPAILGLLESTQEFIVVDNGSSDGSLVFLKKHPRIRLIQSPRYAEKNFACNYAIEQAKGEFILLLDNDILLQEKSLIHNLLQGAKSLPLFGCYALAYSDLDQSSSCGYGGFFSLYLKKSLRKLSNERVKQLHNIAVGNPQGIGLFMKKAFWKQLGGYDESLVFGGDDKDIGMRIWLAGKRCYLYSRTLQIHIGQPERSNTKKYSRKWRFIVCGDLVTILKGYSFFHLIPAIVLYLGFSFAKTAKQSLLRFSLLPSLAWVSGLLLFIVKLPSALASRYQVRSSRATKSDLFLHIRPPPNVGDSSE